jgi:hypothetical protein
MDGPAGDPFLDLVLPEGAFTVRMAGSRGLFPFEGQGPIMEVMSFYYQL